MSEIKGQLLSIVLVLAVFGVVIGIMMGAFQGSAEKIGDRVESIATTEQYVNPAQPAGRAYSLHY